MLWIAEDAMCGAFLTFIFHPVCPISSAEVVAHSPGESTLGLFASTVTSPMASSKK